MKLQNKNVSNDYDCGIINCVTAKIMTIASHACSLDFLDFHQVRVEEILSNSDIIINLNTTRKTIPMHTGADPLQIPDTLEPPHSLLESP